METRVVVGGATAAPREGLELGVTRMNATAGEKFLFSAGEGAAILVMGPQEGSFLFSS